MPTKKDSAKKLRKNSGRKKPHTVNELTKYDGKKSPRGTNRYPPAIKNQNNRNGFVNGLASEINEIIKAWNYLIKPGNFYQNLQGKFRQETGDNRLLLLNQLKGMGINPQYSLERMNIPPVLQLKTSKDIILVELEVNHHPQWFNFKGNCYFYEVLLILWDDSGAACQFSSRKTAWIYPEKGFPVFELAFDKPDGATDHLLCIRESLGLDEVEYYELGTQGTLIMEVGSFNKKSQQLLLERRKEILEKRQQVRQVIIQHAEAPGVAPKLVRDKANDSRLVNINPGK